MDPNRIPGGASGSASRHYTATDDEPPTYAEAMRQPNSTITPTQPTPSAPTTQELTGGTNFYEPIQPQPVAASNYGVQNYPNFPGWDNNAARILILNRLRMQAEFEKAKSDREKEILWNLVLDQLLFGGYHFTIIDLINFWEFQFQIYKNIVNDLCSNTASGDYNTNWEFFQPMDNVFKSHAGTESLADGIPASSTSIVPDTPIESIQTPKDSELPLTTVTNSGVPSISNATSDEHVITTLLPSTNVSNEIYQASAHEHFPLLQTNSSLISDSNAIAGGSDLNLAKVTSISTVASRDLNSSPITTQPEGFTITKFLEDNEVDPVVTKQPISMINADPTIMPVTSTNNQNQTNNDCCCDLGCHTFLCFNTHHHSYSCCDGDDDGNGGGYCCDCDGGCCGDGGGCCDHDHGDGGCCDESGCCDGGGCDADGCDFSCDCC